MIIQDILKCSDGWYYPDSEVNGECKTCSEPTVDGEAQSGCHWGTDECPTCGAKACDQSC